MNKFKKISIISDTHNRHQNINLGSGDILIHAGDFTEDGTHEELQSFVDWFSGQNFMKKILVAGNHDQCLVNLGPETLSYLNQHNIIYLENNTCEVQGLKIFGSPVSLAFGGFDSFQLSEKKIEVLASHWPNDADIYIFHGPPHAILDFNRVPCGSFAVRSFLESLPKNKNRLVAFGHIHQGYGHMILNDLVLVNAAQGGASAAPIAVTWIGGRFQI